MMSSTTLSTSGTSYCKYHSRHLEVRCAFSYRQSLIITDPTFPCKCVFIQEAEEVQQRDPLSCSSVTHCLCITRDRVMAGGETVCVTGASGFIASWLVKTLLEKEKAKLLMELPGASERLELVGADLLKPGSFDSILEGCDGVFHTASPTASLKPGDTLGDPEGSFIEPALKGTLNVLESCAKTRPKQIVLTSSIVSLVAEPSHLILNFTAS